MSTINNISVLLSSIAIKIKLDKNIFESLGIALRSDINLDTLQLL